MSHLQGASGCAAAVDVAVVHPTQGHHRHAWRLLCKMDGALEDFLSLFPIPVVSASLSALPCGLLLWLEARG